MMDDDFMRFGYLNRGGVRNSRILFPPSVTQTKRKKGAALAPASARALSNKGASDKAHDLCAHKEDPALGTDTDTGTGTARHRADC